MRLMVTISMMALCSGLIAQPTLIQTLRDGNPGVDALDGAASAVISADERYLYVAGRFESVISQFEIDPVTGLLAPVQDYRNGTGGIFGLNGILEMVISPDGNHLYAATFDDNSVVVFSRANDTGALTWQETWFDGLEDADFLEGTRDIAISPDGAQVYVLGALDNAITVFQRDPATGLLTWVQSFREDPNDNNLMDFRFPANITIAANGTDVYVTARTGSALFHLTRSSDDGTLTFSNIYRSNDDAISGLGGPDHVVISTDGGHVYVAGDGSAAVTHFTRDTANGELTFVTAYADDNETIDGLEGITSLALDPTGSVLYTASRLDNAVTAFSRADDGSLTQTAVLIDDTELNSSLGGAYSVITALEGRVVYAMARADDAVNVFSATALEQEPIAAPYFLSSDALERAENGDLTVIMPDPNSDGAANRADLGYLVSVLQRGRILTGPILFTPPAETGWPATVTIAADALPEGSFSVGLRRGTSFAVASDEVILPAPDVRAQLPEPLPANFSRWLLHVPRQAGGFDSTLQLANRDRQNAVTVDLVGFDQNGGFLGTESRTLQPGAINSFPVYGETGDALFGGLTDTVSHIAIWEPGALTRASLGFTGIANGFLAAFTEQNLERGETAGTAFTVQGKRTADAQEGIAVLNLTGTEAVEVILEQIDATTGVANAAAVLGTVDPGAKRLFLASDALSFDPASDYVIRTSGTGQAQIQVVWLSISDGGFLATAPVTKIR